MENKELVEIEESKSNETPQSQPSLEKRDVPIWKRAVLLALGLLGIYLIAFVSGLIIMLCTKDQSTIDNVSNLVAYGLLFIIMVSLLIPHVPKCLESFKGWKPYVFGIAGFVAVVSFDQFYMIIINLFYKMPTGGNEEGVRGIVDQFPVLSLIVLGVLGPACEELAYRSGAFNLLRRWNRVVAYIVVGILFGFIHFRPTAETWVSELLLQPAYIFSGVAFCFLYDKFGFASSFMAHSLNNVYAIGSQIIANLIEKFF